MLTDHITAVFERTVTASFARRGEKWWLCLSPRNQTGPATRPWSPFVTSWPASRSNAMCRLHHHEFFLFRLSEVERWPWLPPLPGNVYTKVGNKMWLLSWTFKKGWSGPGDRPTTFLCRPLHIFQIPSHASHVFTRIVRSRPATLLRLLSGKPCRSAQGTILFPKCVRSAYHSVCRVILHIHAPVNTIS